MADNIRATPRNPVLGLFSDITQGGLDYLRDPRFRQAMMQLPAPVRPFGMGAVALPGLFESTGFPKTLERAAYGEPFTNIGMANVPTLKPETADAMMTFAPMIGPAIRATKGLPVGMGIKPINLEKGIYRPELTMEEMLKVKDIPTVERVRKSMELVGEKEFENMVNAQFKKYKPTNQDTEAMLVESVTLNILGKAQRAPYSQQAALDLAQQRAALPVSEGGLGLPAGNTAEQRAAAMGGKDMVHFSRAGGDYTTLDSGKFAIAPFDAVGTHVGTPQAAMERFQNTVGYKVNNPNYANDELRGASYPVTILGDRPLMNQNGMPWGEDDLNAFLRKEGGHNWSDIKGGAMTYQDMNANLRKKLFEEQGYTSIPYYNEVEGKGSISYITPPENIRSRFAAFDPFRRSAAIAAIMGVAAPDLLANELDYPSNPMYTDPLGYSIR